MAGSRQLISGLHSRGNLPHLKRDGGVYFVTFREAGSLPKEVLLGFKQERAAFMQKALASKRPLTWREQEDVFRCYSARVDHYLDHPAGPCHLREPRFAEMAANALKYFAGNRYELLAWVVMANHVHVVVRPLLSYSLSEILHSWKSFTAHEINKLLPAKIVPFWQDESYDHLARNDEDLHRCCQYTIMNPVNAGLCDRPESWKWSSAFGGAEVAQPSPAAGSSGVAPRLEGAGTAGETPAEPADGTPAPHGKRPRRLEVLFAPAEYATLGTRDLSNTVCVVFDVLRATSTMLTALNHGAAEIIPVAEIPEALARRGADPALLLAGERGGQRIRAAQTGSVDFDLGNSPREFTRERVTGRRIAMTTTNGTRALRSCAHAAEIYIGSFLNLSAAARAVAGSQCRDALIICAGTAEEASVEDALAAGALAANPLLSRAFKLLDSAQIAAAAFQRNSGDIPAAVSSARNGRKLLSIPELAPDVPICLQVDTLNFNARLDADGAIRRCKE